VCAAAEIHGDHRFPTQSAGTSELSRSDGAQGHSALRFTSTGFETGAARMIGNYSQQSKHGALPLRPRHLTPLRQNGSFPTGRLSPPLPFRRRSRRSGAPVASPQSRILRSGISRVDQPQSHRSDSI
jgi:hypothetical protein